jgi:hypothetical protein
LFTGVRHASILTTDSPFPPLEGQLADPESPIFRSVRSL